MVVYNVASDLINMILAIKPIVSQMANSRMVGACSQSSI
jgi:hypothetical protein